VKSATCKPLLAMAVAAVGSLPTLLADDVPRVVSDYDSGDVYWVVDGKKQPQHGMREAWVFNRALAWLDEDDGVDGALLCHSTRSPLLLTGTEGASRWDVGNENALTNVDAERIRFEKRSLDRSWDHSCIPPLQFPIDQHPVAELDVADATAPWRLLITVKGRSGPPLFAGAWRRGAGREGRPALFGQDLLVAELG